MVETSQDKRKRESKITVPSSERNSKLNKFINVYNDVVENFYGRRHVVNSSNSADSSNFPGNLNPTLVHFIYFA